MTQEDTTPLRLPRGKVTLAQLEANPKGALLKLEHDPHQALELFHKMAVLAGLLAPILQKAYQKRRGRPGG